MKKISLDPKKLKSDRKILQKLKMAQGRICREKQIETINILIRLILEQWKLVTRTASFVSDILINKGLIPKTSYINIQKYFSFEKLYFQEQFRYPIIKKGTRQQLHLRRIEILEILDKKGNCLKGGNSAITKVFLKCLKAELKYQTVYEAIASFIERVDWNDPYLGTLYAKGVLAKNFIPHLKKCQGQPKYPSCFFIPEWKVKQASKEYKESIRAFIASGKKLNKLVNLFNGKSSTSKLSSWKNRERWDEAVTNFTFRFFDLVTILADLEVGLGELSAQAEVLKKRITKTDLVVWPPINRTI